MPAAMRLRATAHPSAAARITDTFNRADTAAGLGTTSDGTHTWIAQQGTLGITSNVAYMVSNGGSSVPGFGFCAIALIDGGVADRTVKAKIYNGTSLIVRWVDANNFILIAGGGGVGGGIWQQSAGAHAQLASWAAQADGTLIGVAMVGTSFSVTANGVSLGSATSSIGSASTKDGLFGSSAGTTADRWDDFSIT